MYNGAFAFNDSCPSLISLMVSVDVKHHVYVLTNDSCMSELCIMVFMPLKSTMYNGAFAFKISCMTVKNQVCIMVLLPLVTAVGCKKSSMHNGIVYL